MLLVLYQAIRQLLAYSKQDLNPISMDLEQSSFFFLLFPLSSVDRSRASAAYDDVITKQDVFQWIGFVLLTHTRHAYRQTSVAGKPGISPSVLQPTTSFFVQVAVNFIYFVVFTQLCPR